MTDEEYKAQDSKLSIYSGLKGEICTLNGISESLKTEDRYYIGNVKVPEKSRDFITLAINTAINQRLENIKHEMEEL